MTEPSAAYRPAAPPTLERTQPLGAAGGEVRVLLTEEIVWAQPNAALWRLKRTQSVEAAGGDGRVLLAQETVWEQPPAASWRLEPAQSLVAANGRRGAAYGP